MIHIQHGWIDDVVRVLYANVNTSQHDSLRILKFIWLNEFIQKLCRHNSFCREEVVQNLQPDLINYNFFQDNVRI